MAIAAGTWVLIVALCIGVGLLLLVGLAACLGMDDAFSIDRCCWGALRVFDSSRRRARRPRAEEDEEDNEDEEDEEAAASKAAQRPAPLFGMVL